MYNLQKFLKIRVLVNRLWRYLQKCECVSVAAVVCLLCLCVCVMHILQYGVEEYINKLKSEQKKSAGQKRCQNIMPFTLSFSRKRTNSRNCYMMNWCALTLNELSINTGKNNELKCVEIIYTFSNVFLYLMQCAVVVPECPCFSYNCVCSSVTIYYIEIFSPLSERK